MKSLLAQETITQKIIAPTAACEHDANALCSLQVSELPPKCSVHVEPYCVSVLEA